MEQGLREVRERFESAFPNAPVGKALVGLNGEWLQINDALNYFGAPQPLAELLAGV